MEIGGIATIWNRAKVSLGAAFRLQRLQPPPKFTEIQEIPWTSMQSIETDQIISSGNRAKVSLREASGLQRLQPPSREIHGNPRNLVQIYEIIENQ